MKIEIPKTEKVYLPSGTYEAELKNVAGKEVGEDKQFAYYFQWRVREGKYAGEDFVTSFWRDNQESMMAMKKAIQAMGLAPNDKYDSNQLIGRECLVTIEQTVEPFHRAVRYEAIQHPENCDELP
ncbi:hypothetical protein [Desulfatibacillum aliphaticivorans]|uniref:hypothetical protein n=1 Tax=Desulfatibacillum aliphaticivorans TaxID=218208 RepID=UPI0004159E30|nr:hypothetical protein [Desulfatibacillum aliphaticivorans]